MIIGVSSKFNFGRWDHRAYIFETAEAAEKWLHTEEYDFRERELFDDLRPAVELAGAEEITRAIYGEGYTEGDVWKTLRKAYGLTQVKMWEITRVPVRTIQDWERNKRKGSFEYMIDLVSTKLKVAFEGKED